MKAVALLLMLIAVPALADFSLGNGTITAAEQKHVTRVSAEREPWPWGGEYCYYRDGITVNNGWCRSDMEQPKHEARHATGKRWRNPPYHIVYLPTQADIRRECGSNKYGERVLGCTIGISGSFLVFVPESDKGANRILGHELEYHVFRDISH